MKNSSISRKDWLQGLLRKGNDAMLHCIYMIGCGFFIVGGIGFFIVGGIWRIPACAFGIIMIAIAIGLMVRWYEYMQRMKVWNSIAPYEHEIDWIDENTKAYVSRQWHDEPGLYPHPYLMKLYEKQDGSGVMVKYLAGGQPREIRIAKEFMDSAISIGGLEVMRQENIR